MNNIIFRSLSYGVYTVTTLDGFKPTGCVANSVMQITSSPETIAVSINHDNHTNACIKQSQFFGVSVLGENSPSDIIGTFGFNTGKTTDKFAEVGFEYKEGVPVLTKTCGYIVCKMVNSVETSTHTVFIGEVIDCDVFEKDIPMTYAYYHKVLRGTSPKNAPTYIKEEPVEETGKPVYQCSVCGHIYEGETPFNELDDSYTCPICKQPKTVFNKK